MRTNVLICSACALVLLAGLAVAAPPPPPPPGAADAARAVITSPTAEGIVAYIQKFSGDVKVFENSTEVASSRIQFAEYLKAHAWLHTEILRVAIGNPLIAIETINNVGTYRPGVVQDCCWWGRVATYHFNQVGLIDEVRFVDNQAPWTNENGSWPPVGG